MPREGVGGQPVQDGIRPGHEWLLMQPHRRVVEDPEPFMPVRVNRANRVHRASLSSSPSPRNSH